jgi:hypothetical protein
MQWPLDNSSMFIVDLKCEGEHAFEGWYENALEFQALLEADDVTCPLCGSAAVRRVPSASRISTSKTNNAGPSPEPPPTEAATLPLPVQKALSQVLGQVRRTHEYVGDEFSKKARAIHQGKDESRPIYGESTPEEEEELAAEGVPFFKVPIPDIDKN